MATTYTRSERHTVCYHLATPLSSDELAQVVADAEREYRQAWGDGALPADWFYLSVDASGLVLKFRIDQPDSGPRVLDIAATQLIEPIRT